MARTRIKVINVDGKQVVMSTCIGGLFRDNIKGTKVLSSDNIHGRSKSRREALQRKGEQIKAAREKKQRYNAFSVAYAEKKWAEKFANI